MSRVHLLTGVAAVAVATGCASYETKVVEPSFRPDPAHDPIEYDETKSGTLYAETSTDESTLHVQVFREKLCRTLTKTPGFEDYREERKLTPEGRGTQALLGLGAVVGIGAGAYLVGDCSRTTTDESGAEIEQTCTSEEKQGQTALGVGSLAFGVAAGVLFAVNAVRVTDKDGSKRQADEMTTKWARCGQNTVPGHQVTLMVYRNPTRKAATDEAGKVAFDLSEIAGKEAKVVVGDGIVSRVGLEGTVAEAAWNERVAEAREKEMANREAARQKAAERKAELDALRLKCVQGDASFCYELGKALGAEGDREDQEFYYKRACELNYQMGCIAYQELAAKRQEAEHRRRVRAAAEEAHDPLQRARRNYIVECIAENSLSMEGECKKMVDLPQMRPHVIRQCISLCEGDRMGDCQSRCQM